MLDLHEALFKRKIKSAHFGINWRYELKILLVYCPDIMRPYFL